MEIEGIKVVHAIPGRVRLKISQLKGNPSLAQEAQEKLRGVPGIQRVQTNAATGSVLIFHDLLDTLPLDSLQALSGTLDELFPEIGAASLTTWLISLAEAPAAGAANPGGGTDPVAALKAKVGQLGGSFDIRLLLPLTFLFLGVRQLLVSGKLTLPVWYDFFWFALSSFFMLNRNLLEGHQKNT